MRRSGRLGEAIWASGSFPPPRIRSGRARRDCCSHGVKKAKLPPIRRRGWQSLRRKFATELKGVPLKDLCQLGGWKSHLTVLKCYQQPDEDTMRKALEGRRAIAQVREVG